MAPRFVKSAAHALRLLSPAAQEEGAAKVAAINRQLAALEEQHTLLRSHVAKMDADQAELAIAVHHELLNITPGLAEVRRLRAEDRAEVTSLLALLAPRAHGQASRGADALAARVDDADMAAFYEGFEQRFRGTRESVQQKLRGYVADVLPLRHGDLPLLDVGPGRCEWLELLKREGIPSYGVDVNPRFVATGQELGLDVRLEDALAHLRALPARSLAAITAFQVVEHLEPEILFDFVAQSLRDLRPGGILIMETPNPLNVHVGAAQFWIDPSHVRPIHPEFLEYLCVNRGFDRVEIRFANPTDDAPFSFDGSAGASSRELSRLTGTLNHLLFDSMDYAIVASAPLAASAATAEAEPVESSVPQGLMAATSAVAGLLGRRGDAIRRTAGLTRELAWTQFKLKYTGSVLGYLWSLLKPLMLFSIMYAIFVRFFHQTAHDFAVQLLVGIVMFTFFTDCVGAGMASIVANGHLIRKAFFPRAVLVVASSLTAAMTFVINLTLIVIVATPLGHLQLGLRTLAVLPLIAEVYALALGLSLLLSSLFVFYRDLGHIWEILSQVLFYGSGVVYPATLVPPGARGVFFLNPLAQIIEDVRHALVVPDAPWTYSLVGIRFLVPVALCAIVLAAGTVVFRRLTPAFAENL